ncbi:hypothetical protein [Natronosalvus amylolyticus]|uniref:biosurfactant protein 1 n=1 Tax=Natronosalvus amylolyticus TaxID=2961994 RepID=UPI0020C9864E|nr:hypothetical protein [Natronosalvus amylolyticus]
MDQREHDRHELRPLGEAFPGVDPALEEKRDRNLRTKQVRYGSREIEERKSESRCRSCDASIPSDRTKCQFCLSKHIEPVDEDAPRSAEVLLGIGFIITSARTYYEAVAKGAAACRKLVTDEGPIDGYQLVYDIDDPAPQLVKPWPSLHSAATLDSEPGQQLLERLANVSDEDSIRWSTAHGKPPMLYDEWGQAVDDLKDVLELEEKARHWLVPALALHEQLQSQDTTQEEPCIPTKKRLFCQQCDQETIHRFDSRDSVPNPSRPRTSIWNCSRCETPRYGPDPK